MIIVDQVIAEKKYISVTQKSYFTDNLAQCMSVIGNEVQSTEACDSLPRRLGLWPYKLLV